MSIESPILPPRARCVGDPECLEVPTVATTYDEEPRYCFDHFHDLRGTARRCAFCRLMTVNTRTVALTVGSHTTYYLGCRTCSNAIYCGLTDDTDDETPCRPQYQCSSCSQQQDHRDNGTYDDDCDCSSCVDVRDSRRDDDDDDDDDERPSGLFIEASTITFHPAKTREERKVNPSGRMLAAEIEVASRNSYHDATIRDMVVKWGGSIVHDGSLPSGGFEINTAPAGGDHFIRQIDEICGALNAADAEVTTACGLHVHIDCRDHNYFDMRKLIRMYAFLEPAIIATQPKSRVLEGSYCRPCGAEYVSALVRGALPKDKDKVPHSMKSAVTEAAGLGEQATRVWVPRKPRADGSRRRARGANGEPVTKMSGNRYNALNINSWFYRGTVECRLHTGSTDAGKIQKWATTWATIIDKTYAMSQKDVDAMVRTQTPRDAFIALAPEPARDYLNRRMNRYGSGFLNWGQENARRIEAIEMAAPSAARKVTF